MSLSYRSPVARLFYRCVIWPAETLLLFIILLLLSVLNIRAASYLFGSIFSLIGPLTPWHRRAAQQIHLAMPALSPPEISKILNGMWQNLGRNVAEYPKLESMLRAGYIHFEGLENLHGQEGGFIIGAHLGNWEALAMIGPHLGLRTGLIYRPLNNPYISFLLKRRAIAAKADIYEKGREAAMGMVSTIRKGGYMLMLADQQLREGEDIDFFAKPARTAIAHFKVAAKTGKPIFFAQTYRQKGCQILVKISPPIWIAKSATEDDILIAAKKMNQQFEEWIMAHPEQWLWPHRRWGKMAQSQQAD